MITVLYKVSAQWQILGDLSTCTFSIATHATQTVSGNFFHAQRATLSCEATLIVEVEYRDLYGDVKTRTLIQDNGFVIATTKTVQTLLLWDKIRVRVLAVRFLAPDKKHFDDLPDQCVECLDSLNRRSIAEPVAKVWRRHYHPSKFETVSH